MNFRTTLLLLVVLIAAGVSYFVLSSNEPKTEVRTDDESGQQTTGSKLISGVTTANVNKVVVASPTGGKTPLVFERQGTSDWRMRTPIDAPADSFKVEDLIREVLELRTTGRTSPAGKGFDPPQYVVELLGDGGKTTRLEVGTSSPVSDILYVKLVGGSSKGDADIVSASLVAQLEKTANDYRKNRLLPGFNNEDVEAVTITHGDQTLKLKRVGNTDWDILEPKPMPGDTAQISTLLSSITGLSAVKFVSEDAKNVAKYGLDAPQMTITLATTPPSTQPSASAAQTKPAGEGSTTTTVRFGEPSDFSKKNVYAVASDKGPVVTIAATDLEALKNKKALDLRDREVLDLDPNRVSRISIAVDKPATTQPTTRPAEKREVVLERRSDGATPATSPVPAPAPAAAPAAPAPAPQPQSRVTTPDGGAAVTLAAFQESATPAGAAAPAAPAAEPTTPANGPSATTAPAATQSAATQPAKPQTKWLLASDPKGDANDANVQALLTALRPLRAEKFLDAPATQPASVTTYVVRIKTSAFADDPAKELVLTITDPGGEAAKLTGRLDDLTFELDRAIVEHLTAEFAAPKVEPAGPALPPGLPGFPPPAAPPTPPAAPPAE